MAKEVAIKVSVNGTQQAVKSIDDLEKSVNDLKTQLKGVEIGSTEFKKLSGEVQQAESKLKTLNKSFEGLEPQQKAEAFVKLGEGIAGSFAIATAALTAFGVESEDVEKAQLAVTQALTAAIGIRQLAEAGLQAQVIATTISQAAYNAAATAGNVVTKAFYTTIAANPIGAVIAAVAALGLGIYALVSAMEEEITSQELVNDALDEASTKTIEQEVRISSLTTIINDNTESMDDRQRALNALAEILPELEGLELSNEEAIIKVNAATERAIKLIKLRAQAEAISALITKSTTELIENQNKSLDEQVGFWEKAYISITSLNGAIAAGRVVQAGFENQQEETNRLQKDINKFTEDYVDLLGGLLELEEEEDDIITKTNKSKERASELDKAREEERKREIELLREELKLRTTILAVSNVSAPTPPIIEDLNKDLSELENIINAAFPDTIGEKIANIFDFPKLKVDEFGNLAAEILPMISKELLSSGEDFNGLVKSSIDLLSSELRDGNISKVAFDAGIEIINQYKDLKKELENEGDIFGDVFNTEAFFKVVTDVKIANGEILTDTKRVNGELVISDAETKKTLTQAQADYNRFISQSRAQFIDQSLKDQDVLDEGLKAGFTKVVNGVEEIDTEALAKQLGEVFDSNITNINNLTDSIVGAEQQIKGFLRTAVDLNKEIEDSVPEARVGIFISESKAIIEQAGIEVRERQRLFGLLKGDVESFAEFRLRSEKELIEQFPEFEKLSADERLRVIEDFYAKKKAARDEDAQQEKSDAENFFENLAKGLRGLANTAQVANGIFQEQLQVQLEQITAQTEGQLENIIGDTEEANAKRLEIQEEFEEKKKEITKKGRLADLQLTRLQAVANVAEAITKAQAAGPLVGQILAGITAGLGAVQVGIVTQQINSLQNFARGGLLNGLSHEAGGIRLAGGGVVAEGGEAVINRRASIDYRGLLSEANMSSGGAPLVNSAFDDTRLIEAISRQNRNPIKAYVLEQDITRSQGVNKRLQQLSKI